MTKRLAILVLAVGMCMGLATQVTTYSIAQPQDDKMQGQDKGKMDDSKMSGDKMDHKDKKKSKKHKKDKMDKMHKMDKMDDKK